MSEKARERFESGDDESREFFWGHILVIPTLSTVPPSIIGPNIWGVFAGFHRFIRSQNL